MFDNVVLLFFFKKPDIDLHCQQTWPDKADQTWHQAVPYMEQDLPTQTNADIQGAVGSLFWPEQACSLDSMHIDRSDTEVKILVRALNIVACAFRPLDAEELIEALTTQISPLVGCQDWEGDVSWLRTSEDLRTLCVGFLEIQDGGVVQFSNGNMKNSVLSHKFATLNLPRGSDGHELLAMVCIQHLQCLPPRLMLRPWVAATHWRTKVKHNCALRSYTAKFWHEHSRIALLYSREIPAMLHRAFMSASSVKEDHEPTSKEKTNMGLWLSTVNNFRLLCRTYLEMGADPNSCTDWHEAPIHTAARSAPADMIRLLIERGADLELRNVEGLTPLHVACRSGNLEAAQIFIEMGADVKAQTSDKTMSYNGARTPLHHALFCGQLEIVRMLLSQPRLGMQGLQQAKLTLENLGSDMLAFEVSCGSLKDHCSLLHFLDVDFLEADLLDLDVLNLDNSAKLLIFIFSQESERFGQDMGTLMPIIYGKTHQQRFRRVPQNVDNCLRQPLNTFDRGDSSYQGRPQEETQLHPDVSLQNHHRTCNDARFIIDCQSRLRKLADHVDFLQLEQVIDILRRHSKLSAVHAEENLEQDVAGEWMDKISSEGSGVLPWVRMLSTTRAAASQTQEPNHSPEPFPTEIDLVDGTHGHDSFSHIVCKEDLSTTYARQHFSPRLPNKKDGKHEEGFPSPAHGTNPALPSAVHVGTPSVRPCSPVRQSRKQGFVVFSEPQILVSPDVHERIISIRSKYVEMAPKDAFRASSLDAFSKKYTDSVATNYRTTNGEDWLMVDKDDVDMDIW